MTTSQGPLTARYRPQRFADVAGQEMVAAILSRAAAEDRIAPAYLFSGTRGVGKTTCARIFAKAINCLEAPTPEPCNVCRHCRQITQGSNVDVVEIDGASNRGIDDARRLREDIGYAPMDCRYKVFIIDEAHMLTREAFNALLKTLEEPPGNVTFILATTEAHKFPATIISRCQHFLFKRLTHERLIQHLAGVLERENVPHDGAAVRLLARRAAGSVRDSMSLLGQVLALGQGRLEESLVRDVLGLAGQEALMEVLAAVQAQNPAALALLLRRVLDQGLDMGFFLRELAQAWRNLFLLKENGEAALPLLEMSQDEARTWLDCSAKFSLAHIHAAWQLTLEGQRRVLASLEPALALELLLLNMALLPRLLPVASLQPPPNDAPTPAAAPSPASPIPTAPAAPATPPPVPTSTAPGLAAPGAAPRTPPWEERPAAPASPAARAAVAPGQVAAFQEAYRARVAAQNQGSRLLGVGCVLEGQTLRLTCEKPFAWRQLTEPEHWALLESLAREILGPGVRLEAPEPEQPKSYQEIETLAREDPVVQAVQAEMGAVIKNVKPL